MGYYFEVIPIGEIINGVKIIKRVPQKTIGEVHNNEKGYSVFLCECMCGKQIYRTVNMIYTGALYMCEDCRKKHNIKVIMEND